MSSLNLITQTADQPRRNRKGKPNRVFLAAPSPDGSAPRQPRRPLGSDPTLLEAARHFLTLKRALDAENTLSSLGPDYDADELTFTDLMARLDVATTELIAAMGTRPVVVLDELGKAFVVAVSYLFGDPNQHVSRIGLLDVAGREDEG